MILFEWFWCNGCCLSKGQCLSYFIYYLFADETIICSTSAAHVSLVLSRFGNASASDADVEHIIVLAACFQFCFLTKYWFVLCQHVSPVLSPLHIYGVLAADLNMSLFRFYCFWHCLFMGNRFVQCQQHLHIRINLYYNSSTMAATSNKSLFQHVYFLFRYCVFE